MRTEKVEDTGFEEVFLFLKHCQGVEVNDGAARGIHLLPLGARHPRLPLYQKKALKILKFFLIHRYNLIR